ncbi:MAG: ECF transporter S component [Ruminiclostridium sp.]|nr:ECF transporter S component [Ruminiclostridium sp.]
MYTYSQSRNEILRKLLIAFLSVVAAVALPQICHYIGVLTGTGANLGAMLLPMHIPVLLAGFLGGAVVGTTAGVISPLISFAISGMPSAALLPFMVIELAVYGLVAGVLSKKNMNAVLKTAIVLLSGRIARALAVLTSIYAFGNEKLAITAAYMFIVEGVIGTLIQLIVIPFVISRKKA